MTTSTKIPTEQYQQYVVARDIYFLSTQATYADRETAVKLLDHLTALDDATPLVRDELGPYRLYVRTVSRWEAEDGAA